MQPYFLTGFFHLFGYFAHLKFDYVQQFANLCKYLQSICKKLQNRQNPLTLFLGRDIV